jgi:hypothetical protein
MNVTAHKARCQSPKRRFLATLLDGKTNRVSVGNVVSVIGNLRVLVEVARSHVPGVSIAPESISATTELVDTVYEPSPLQLPLNSHDTHNRPFGCPAC